MASNGLEDWTKYVQPLTKFSLHPVLYRMFGVVKSQRTEEVGARADGWPWGCKPHLKEEIDRNYSNGKAQENRYVPLRVKDDGERGGGMAMEEGEGRHKNKEKRVLNSGDRKEGVRGLNVVFMRRGSGGIFQGWVAAAGSAQDKQAKSFYSAAAD
ncbi:hypothetical protein EYF80_045768 [Liparis tanakae]|uniref:Uncharacterized protein n=1 Tax=Liparis tanakae TaxID=230148 RepID=A0A4Z2FTK0_9TELE|nr:hypothetical protein EYF80_045768 [Liparis tanakae]